MPGFPKIYVPWDMCLWRTWLATLRLGKGTEMAKVDVSQAYRNLPVHPADIHLLGME